MQVTRTLIANQPDALRRIAQVAGGMRADIWHRFGALKGIGRSVNSIKPEIPKLYGQLPIDGTIRSETAKNVINNIKGTSNNVRGHKFGLGPVFDYLPGFFFRPLLRL
jgi:hypothetical protein